MLISERSKKDKIPKKQAKFSGKVNISKLEKELQV